MPKIISFLLIFLLCGNFVFAQKKCSIKPKYKYTTEYTSTVIQCHELYEKELYEDSYLEYGWVEYDCYYSHTTNIKFSSQDYYTIYVTFKRKDSILIKPSNKNTTVVK